ncbi:MAG: 1-acyl-sn-glycerol-3-phosphate acyltransferase [Actinobacteria bacterium]|nr:1-acyl-sn-glycerol-3-phosphate acyltransferase [Actinomycetota bacterium]
MESTRTYPSPTGFPLGTNRAFKICAGIVIPILRLITKRDWSGQANIPQSGPAIVASNHMSYFDVLFLAEYLFVNGRAPRFIGKSSVFKTPILGRIVTAAEQIPVDRESGTASKALDHAIAAIEAGHLIGIYPEGTLTRDTNLWPMVAKTGIARLAIITMNPVIPIAAWGPQKVLPQYSKKPHLWPRTRITMRAGEPIDMSAWYGKEDDQGALAEATAHIMKTLTIMLEDIRGERAPIEVFDPHTSELPRTGNYKKALKRRRS